MAKVRHNNFLDTVDEVFTDAKRVGVIHLYTEGDKLTGRHLTIKGKRHFHFGTTGYLGLEQDFRLKNAAIQAILKYGTQFPLSKTYVSHPLYKTLEEKLEMMYGHPVIVTKNSTLGHIGVIPVLVRDEDGAILDHQVHWSVQNACQILKTRGIPVELIRHNHMDMLEDKIKELSTSCDKIWYMADGIYSMFGDCSPIPELMDLCDRYPQLHLYFDDVHGMSWSGKNGTGYVMGQLGTLPENVVLMSTLSKTFGASGAIMVTSHHETYRKIKTYGGPLTFSAQLEPASVATAIMSANIHLSDEIYEMQKELFDRVAYFNGLLEATDLPLVQKNNCPVRYIGTGIPATGYNFINRLMNDGFFVNLGLYPAVPVKNTGVRITISRHNQKPEIKALVEAMAYHFPKALEDTNTTNNKVRRDFKMPHLPEKQEINTKELRIQHERSIRRISKHQWDSWMGKRSVFDWEGVNFLEQSFADNGKPEHHYAFHYLIVRDKQGDVIAASFFTVARWKEDMLAPASVSRQLEEKRKKDPYYLTSDVLAMGSLFTEGQHYYLNQEHPKWQEALRVMIDKLGSLDEHLDTSMLVLRDFEEDEALNQFFHTQGFIRVKMPESCVLNNLSWTDLDGYLSTLSARARRHFRKDIQPFEQHFDIFVKDKATHSEIDQFYQLFENVRAFNHGLNTFSFPRKLFENMVDSPIWEFIVLYLKKERDQGVKRKPVGVMFCYKNHEYTYVPAFIGMDYDYVREYQVYRQMLYQTILRAKELNFKRIDFGMTAAFEKKKVGADITEKYAYVQAKDNFNMELMGVMQSGK